MPEMSDLPESSQSGIGMNENSDARTSPVPECSGTGLRCMMPESASTSMPMPSYELYLVFPLLQFSFFPAMIIAFCETYCHLHLSMFCRPVTRTISKPSCRTVNKEVCVNVQVPKCSTVQDKVNRQVTFSPRIKNFSHSWNYNLNRAT